MIFTKWWLVLIWVSAFALGEEAPPIFTEHGDVGATKHAGSFEFDPARLAYTVTGGGANMWAMTDAFQFVWKKVSGDATLAADISFEGPGGDPHRKACLIIRQSLDADSPYADAALHGEGLTSLQYRETKGERTYEIQSAVSGPKRLRIEKHGRYVSMSIAGAGEELHPAGGAFRLELTEPYYIGLGVCAHNDEVTEKAVFTNVELTTGTPAPAGPPAFLSVLETVKVASKDRRAVWSSNELIEAPVWTHDGTLLIFNSKGWLQRVPVVGGEPQLIETGVANHCDRNHALSPDGTTLVFCAWPKTGRNHLYTLAIGGGASKLLAETGLPDGMAWSPDARTVAYGSGLHVDASAICTIPAGGGPETWLAGDKLAGNPDYSADGQWIYFNSNHPGQTQIWRMHPDGSAPEQVTSDEFNNVCPHPSPDGKWLVFLSFGKSADHEAANRDVTLRIMPLAGGKMEVLAKLLGGAGTISAPCWSPDSLRVAFVSQQPRL